MAGMLLGSALLLSACRFDLDTGDREQAVVSYEVTERLTALVVHADAGEVVVNESDRPGVRVTETLHWGGNPKDRPRTEHPVEGGTLTLRHTCSGNCSVDSRIEVPKGLKVTLDTGSGGITLRALTGEVQAHTGSGDIEAGSLGTGRFVADTGSGDVEVRFGAVPGHVEIETGSGDATVRLPPAAYKVTAETGSGERTVKVTDDPSSARGVLVRTGSGDAKILPA
ncbi:lipoprotein [Streptosporangium violaceochromogenes]|nr:lipoprotein [Streptosporangium violaceochromogenes]